MQVDPRLAYDTGTVALSGLMCFTFNLIALHDYNCTNASMGSTLESTGVDSFLQKRS